MRAGGMNGPITEVKQLKTKANSKMGDYLGSIDFGVFFSLAEILSKFFPILAINRNFGKTQNVSKTCIKDIPNLYATAFPKLMSSNLRPPVLLFLHMQHI